MVSSAQGGLDYKSYTQAHAVLVKGGGNYDYLYEKAG